MDAIIKNFVMGRHHQKCTHIVIILKGLSSRADASKYVGKTVSWKCPGKQAKEIKGKIASPHGSKGAVRAIFEKGLPGQAMGTKVLIQ